ncbi:ferric reductase-like transmembrane domain-containing protein, partial [Streptomyces sp. NPDC005534]
MTTVHERVARQHPVRGRRRPRRSPAGPLLALLWAGAAGVLALWWTDTPAVVATAGRLTDAGRISGLLCGYSCAVLVALMARVPLLERRVGSDRVARWHAMAGRYTICLLVAHITLILFGYAAQDGAGIVHETLSVVLDYPDMLKATAGAVILLAVGITSAHLARRRISHEFWYYVHLLTYAAVFLAFFHQVSLGSDFVGNPAARTAWYALYLGTAGLVLWFRVLTPVRLNLRHRLRVESVHREAPGVFSVVIGGERLGELDARAGQFFRWRFLADGMRWTSTPYSLSAPLRPDRLRITVKALGDHSTAVGLLRPGTRVWAEGPYGSLTADRSTASRSLLIAGGVGITPLRALFEELPGRLTLLYRARTAEDLALGGELEAIARWR